MVDAKVGKSLAGKTYPITREAEVDKPGRNRFQRGGDAPRLDWDSQNDSWMRGVTYGARASGAKAATRVASIGGVRTFSRPGGPGAAANNGCCGEVQSKGQAEPGWRNW